MPYFQGCLKGHNKSILTTRVLQFGTTEDPEVHRRRIDKALGSLTPTTAPLVMHPPMTCKQTASITEQQEPGLIGQAKRIQLVAGAESQNESAMNVYKYKHSVENNTRGVVAQR